METWRPLKQLKESMLAKYYGKARLPPLYKVLLTCHIGKLETYLSFFLKSWISFVLIFIFSSLQFGRRNPLCSRRRTLSPATSNVRDVCVNNDVPPSSSSSSSFISLFPSPIFEGDSAPRWPWVSQPSRRKNVWSRVSTSSLLCVQYRLCGSMCVRGVCVCVYVSVWYR